VTDRGLLIALGFALALTACASYGPVYWDQRGVDPTQFARDDNGCRAMASISFGPPGVVASGGSNWSLPLAAGGGPAIDRDLYISCMRRAGYRESPAAGAPATDR
jgi:hypothetical protein